MTSIKKTIFTSVMSKAKKNYSRITTRSLSEMKANGEKIAMLTAYDFTMAGIIDKAGIDVLLVGDSASNVMAGHETTLPITFNTDSGLSFSKIEKCWLSFSITHCVMPK